VVGGHGKEGAAMSGRCVAAWGGHEPPRPHAGTGSPQGLPFARSAANLRFASEVIQMDGVSLSETVSAPRGRVQEKSQEPDGASGRSMDGPRRGSAARSVMSNHQNHAENVPFSAVAAQWPESSSGFFPILPADVSAGDSAFRFLGSKTDPILHVSYPSPWNVVADFAAASGENRENRNWRCLLTLVGTAILGADYEIPGRRSR